MPNLPGTSRVWVLAVLLLLAAGRANAQSVTLAWDPNTEPDLAGYIIGYGTAPGQNQATVDVGMATQWTLSGFTAGQTYYFRVYAYNNLGMRSAPSGEVSTTVGGTSTGGCLGTPPSSDWVCFSGAWLPPDSPLLGGQDEPAPAPPATSSCAGSAPAAGWVCLDGNWLPPDSPLLWSAPAPSGCSGSAPGMMWQCVNGTWVPPTTSTGTGDCTTLSPGSDWVCLNGNWLPPGSPLLAAPAPATPAPAPTAPTPAYTCAGTSPGLGWVCVSGNWLPPGHPLITSTQTTAPAPAPAPAPTGCVTPSPGLSWVCVSGNWLPPDHPLVKGGA